MLNASQLYSKYKLTPEQQSNINGILYECDEHGITDKRQIAYVLATVKHECANTWKPIKEYGGAAYFIKRYWLNSKVAKWLGNDDANDAVAYSGKGYVQITGEANYARFKDICNVDLLTFPDLAMQPQVAAKIIVYGMKWGSFTGKKLSHYFDVGEDPINARRIINSLDKANLIAGYYKDILSTL